MSQLVLPAFMAKLSVMGYKQVSYRIKEARRHIKYAKGPSVDIAKEILTLCEKELLNRYQSGK